MTIDNIIFTYFTMSHNLPNRLVFLSIFTRYKHLNTSNGSEYKTKP